MRRGSVTVRRRRRYSLFNHLNRRLRALRCGRLYWKAAGGGRPSVLAACVPVLNRRETNPIIAPRADNEWESYQTFNPAVLQTEEGVHILYRAQGHDYISRLGYARTKDGFTIEERAPDPVYTCASLACEKDQELLYNQIAFASGGRFAGCEDPRLTRIGDTVHMFFVAFDGRNIPRLATTSIAYDDFKVRNWKWSPAKIVSQPGIIDKSGCLLPEKIDGKYVVFHRVFPNILIDYMDNLDFEDGAYLEGKHSINIRPGAWDSRKIGAGAPPIKTEHGWLLIYYAVDNNDSYHYKIGAMLLDLNNPTRVLRRTSRPILEPRAFYENCGHKSGIAYPCGAAVIEDQLFVYYGGADTYVCTASVGLTGLLEGLLREPCEN